MNSANDRSFEYLLNAFEQASQHDQPATQGYAAKRKAVFDYVSTLRAQAMEAETLRQCRDDVYLLAHRIKRNPGKMELFDHVIRICESAGAKFSPLREITTPGEERHD